MALDAVCRLYEEELQKFQQKLNFYQKVINDQTKNIKSNFKTSESLSSRINCCLSENENNQK